MARLRHPHLDELFHIQFHPADIAIQRTSQRDPHEFSATSLPMKLKCSHYSPTRAGSKIRKSCPEVGFLGFLLRSAVALPSRKLTDEAGGYFSHSLSFGARTIRTAEYSQIVLDVIHCLLYSM